jgi:regulator of protease activity HflC (stomatin/prohibitin superfamily)
VRFPIPRRVRLGHLAVGALCSTSVVYLSLKSAGGDGGLKVVAHDQLAVAVDYRTGNLAAIDQPGTRAFLPWFQDVVRLDRRPVEYVMAGNERLDPNHVPRLLVRASDGTTYGFERVEIQYALDADQPQKALTEMGAGGAYRDGLLDALARPVLRDAFGRLSPREAVLPAKKQAATEAVRTELGLALAPYGIEVLEVSVSKPIFSKKYEQTISRRRVADEDTERMGRELDELVRGQAARLTQLRGMETLKAQKELSKLEAALAQARWVASRAVAEAEADARATLEVARRSRDEKLAEADARVETYAKENEGFRAQIGALAAQGELAVRAALIESLASVPVTVEPFESRDAANARQAGRDLAGGVE